MKVTMHEPDIAEVIADAVIISTPQDALDFMMDPELNGSTKIILRRENISSDFFTLETGLAGEVVQKLVNYGFQLAIVGDFTTDIRPSLRAFIVESNRGKYVFFAKDSDEARQLLIKK